MPAVLFILDTALGISYVMGTAGHIRWLERELRSLMTDLLMG